ncbi:hypothetical protein Pcinc_007559 [Petrolisthes cinctipes]|uniref:Uncharacterized protein n=1 Tax=Petrolisthes cinctipes TaxID=88211 RepID=A0AAE1G963_PETCI|nr:hypothetical protein Pcinc_007559 [Petrolisthes cinctipes]
MLLDEGSKLYLTFACLIIQNFETLNAGFQATNPDPTKLFQELEELRDFLVQKVYRDFRQRWLLWLLNYAKLGAKFEYDLKASNLSAERKTAIQQRCQAFIHEAINQIDKRIDNTSMKMNYVKYLAPEKCLSQMRPRFCDHPLEKLAKDEKFDVQKVANQYERIHMKTKWNEEFPDSEIPKDPVKFWTTVQNYENVV